MGKQKEWMLMETGERGNRMDDERQRTIVEWIDARPTKRIITNKAMRCGFNQAMAEIIDNCLDYWEDLDKPHALEIHIKVVKTPSEHSCIFVTWNMGVPHERWRPLLTPGEVSHMSPKSIGVWGEGFKIAIFSTGKEIDIVTDVEGEQFHIDIPEDFLEVEEWRIPVLSGAPAGVSIPRNHTTVMLKGSKYNEHPSDLERVAAYLAEVFGTRAEVESEHGYGFKIVIDGKTVQPRTFGMPTDIRERFSFPPGFEPTVHKFSKGGLDITMKIGLLSKADKENYGVFMYGNDRLFAKAVRDTRLGFGLRANSPVPMNHPLAMRLQIHVFFEGDSEQIPWRAPLKDNVDLDNSIIKEVGRWIRKYATPYAEFMKSAKASEFLPYSSRWNTLGEDERVDKILTKSERADLSSEQRREGWKSLPKNLKGQFVAPMRLEVWDHKTSGKGRRPSESPKFSRKEARKVVKLVRKRDQGKITTFDLHNRLQHVKLGVTDESLEPGKREIEEKREEQLKMEEEPLFDPSEGSVTLSVRMDAVEANELAGMVAERRKSILLKRVVDTYKSIQSLKQHEYLIDRKEMWSDEDLVEEIRLLFDAQVPRWKRED